MYAFPQSTAHLHSTVERARLCYTLWAVAVAKICGKNMLKPSSFHSNCFVHSSIIARNQLSLFPHTIALRAIENWHTVQKVVVANHPSPFQETFSEIFSNNIHGKALFFCCCCANRRICVTFMDRYIRTGVQVKPSPGTRKWWESISSISSPQPLLGGAVCPRALTCACS